MTSTRSGWVGLLVAAIACGGTSSTGITDGGGGGDSGSSSGGGSGGSSSGSDGGGGTTISGSGDGTPFTNAATALWLGAPDSAATTVVYVFSNPVQCSDLATPGWDKRITDKTQFLEMKMFGTAPATFTVTTSVTPAPGEASVNYTLSSQTATPVETGGTGGTVVLTTVNASTDVTGTFDLQFGTNKLTGTYDATYCPGGHEP
ncbi:MAG TPA: hypothetical protein VIF15_13240 [Polyangiaceae bacterium]